MTIIAVEENEKMDDLISRQAAIDEAKELIDAVYFEETDKRERKAIECVIGSLKELPSADAVEAVRCKDCIHAEHWYRDRSRCFLWHEDGISVFDDGYCSYGERKTDGSDRKTNGNI